MSTDTCQKQGLDSEQSAPKEVWVTPLAQLMAVPDMTQGNTSGTYSSDAAGYS